MTSHDVVGFLRKVLHIRRIGHTGTLDPGACGVLPICVGKGTKLVPFLMDKDKRYVAEMTLGFSTDTGDSAGKTLAMKTDFQLSPKDLGTVLAQFLGESEQIPPMASAIKFQGKKLYEYARRGEEVPRKPRKITIYELHVNKVYQETENPDVLSFGTRLLLDVSCSKGTYIRSLLHDMGLALGTFAHVSFLARTQAGPFSISAGYTLEEIEEMTHSNDYSFLLPMDRALPHWPKVTVCLLAEKPFRHGNAVSVSQLLPLPPGLDLGSEVLVYNEPGELLALGRLVEGSCDTLCKPVRMVTETENPPFG